MHQPKKVARLLLVQDLMKLRCWFTGAVSGRCRPRRSGLYGTHWTFSVSSNEMRDVVETLLLSIGVSPSPYSNGGIRISNATSIAKIRDQLLVFDLLPNDDKAFWEEVVG